MSDKQKGYKIIGKVLIKGDLALLSPMVIGSGQQEESDLDLIRMPNGECYIPGSSLAGKIRKEHMNYSTLDDKMLRILWPPHADQSAEQLYQSHIVIDSAKISGDQQVVVEDAVKLYLEDDTKEDLHYAGTVENKFDYQILQPGCTFSFFAELTAREYMSVEDMNKAGQEILNILHSDFRIGAKTMAGYGRLKLENSQISHLDFSATEDQNKWVAFIGGDEKDLWVKYAPQSIKKNGVKICLTASIDKAILTSVYPTDPDQADKTQKSRYVNDKDKEFVISGKSIKGALNHRACQILNYSFGKAPDRIHKIHRSVFGFVDEDSSDEKNKAQKSRLVVNEMVISTEKAKLSKQTRIKIDRFTGGTIDGALMETEPFF